MEDGKTYRWETGYERTWEIIQNTLKEANDDKNFEKALQEHENKGKQKKLALLSKRGVKLGIRIFIRNSKYIYNLNFKI